MSTSAKEFHLTVNENMDNPIVIASATDFPPQLDGYRDSLFAQLIGKNFHKSTLVLNMDGVLTTYELYSEAAWFVAQMEANEEKTKATLVTIYRFHDIVDKTPVYVGQTKKNVEKRIQQHVNRALCPGAQDQVHTFLRRRIEEGNFPEIQIAKTVSPMAAKNAELEEIRRLLTAGAPLFNRESTNETTRARLLMPVIQLPIRDAQ